MPPVDDPGALIGAGGLAYVDDRFEEARAQWEQAFRLLREAGQLPAAARVATLLGELHWGGLGNASIGRGWLERARRLLDEAGPCVEWGYWELARLACDRPDMVELEQSAERALAIAATHGDVGLHMRALADGGYALVCQGRLGDGFARLEEALAVLSGGEVADPFALSTTACALLSACDRAGDLDRATEWLRVVQQLILGPAEGRPRMLGAHCQIALGGVLCSVGRRAEAEAAILVALDPGSAATAAQRVLATSRLAELRVEAGRVEEAAQLLAPIEDQPAAARPLALVHLDRGEPRLAVAALRQAVAVVVGDVLRQAELLSLLADAELRCDNGAAALATSEQLSRLAATSGALVVAGFAALVTGRIQADQGATADACASFESARAAFAAAERAVSAAEAQLAMAEALAPTAPEDAVVSARAVHAAAIRLGVDRLRDRSAALLRRLGVSPPRPVTAISALKELSQRESAILDGLRQGSSNAEIASRLFLSPKTVEHHVSRIFVKLGVRSRAEAAALAAAAAATLDVPGRRP